MAPQELARQAAREIVERVGRGDLREAPIDLATRYIEGAINRALAEQAVQEIVHTYTQPLGGVDHKLTHSTTGITLETDVSRPRQAGETFEQAAAMSAALVSMAYRVAALKLADEGVVVGPFKRAAS